MRRTGLVLFLIVLGSAGCAMVPPQKIPIDRVNYLDAISTSWKEQLLNNLVFLRYGDTLTSLEMVSVNTTYGLDSQITANYPILWHPLHSTYPQSGWTGGFRNTVTLGGSVIYQDHPSIAYSPMRGEALAKTMIEPLNPYKILSSLQTGWNSPYVFACCVKSINRLRNRAMTGRYGDPEFFRLAHDIRVLMVKGVIQIIVDRAVTEKAEQNNTKTITTTKDLTGKETTTTTTGDRGEKISAFISVDKERANTPELKNDLNDFIMLLGLDANLPQYSVINGNRQSIALGTNCDKIVLQTRSINETLHMLSMFIDVPPQHIKDERAKPSPLLKRTEEGLIDEKQPLDGPDGKIKFIIHSSPERPSDAFVAVKNRGYWFYINDTDLISKEVFSAIAAILSMSETGTKEGAPILTLPVQ